MTLGYFRKSKIGTQGLCHTLRGNQHVASSGSPSNGLIWQEPDGGLCSPFQCIRNLRPLEVKYLLKIAWLVQGGTGIKTFFLFSCILTHEKKSSHHSCFQGTHPIMETTPPDDGFQPMRFTYLRMSVPKASGCFREVNIVFFNFNSNIVTYMVCASVKRE